MPFTLAHPAAVLPLLRHPFVPAALVAGSMAPDVPYFLNAAGIRSTTAGDWYEPLLNATTTHSLGGLPIDVLYALVLVGAYWLIRTPITALLPPSLGLPAREGFNGRYVLWLLISASIGVITHVLWDALTEVAALRLLQYVSTAIGLAVVAWFLWKHRASLRTHSTPFRLNTATRRLVVALLIATPLLAAAVLAPRDYNAYTEVQASWPAIAEGVLTGAAKRAGAALAIAVLVYAAAYHLTARRRRTAVRRGFDEG